MGTHENRLSEAVLTSTHNLCFEFEKYQNFLSEIFPFLVVKISMYLNRRVFVMLMTLYICTKFPENTCWPPKFGQGL